MSKSVFPHSRLFVGPLRTVSISGPFIQVLSTTTGDVLHSSYDFADLDKDAILKSGPVRCASIDSSAQFLATAGDDKYLKIWELSSLKLISSRELPKRPSEISFSRDSQSLLVSDKFGDIFRYSLHPTVPPEKQKRDALTSHDNPSGGQLILGHASLLTSFLLTLDEQYIVTADRDEHIRVSWYPQGYTIERYCLGHEKYISAIHIPEFSPSVLISGGGDPMLKIWDWMSGEVKHEINIFTAIEPFIKIKPTKRQRGGNDDHDAFPGPKVRRKRNKRQRRSQNVIAKEAENEKDEMDGGDNAVEVAGIEADTPELDELPFGLTEQGETVLVIHKIDSLESQDGRFVIFSAVGATALFNCYYPNDKGSDIRHFDFRKPVLDFVIAQDGLIWVTVDRQWADRESSDRPENLGNMIHVLRLVSGDLIEVDDVSTRPLLLALNINCLLPATVEDLKTLDLYSPLTAMPKNSEVDQEPLNRELSVAEVHDLGGPIETLPPGKKISKRILGRIKNQQAVLSKLKTSESGGPIEGPVNKRAKSELGDDKANVVMDNT